MNQKMAVKGFTIAGLSLVILIALWIVNSVIDDRKGFRDDAVKSIEASYAGQQTVIGPVLVRPYTQTVSTVEQDAKGNKKTVVRTDALTAISFPHALDVRGELKPSERRHGLYKVTVYEFAGHSKGSFEVVDPQTEGTVLWGEPYLAISVQDVRGIVGTPSVTVNGVPEPMFQGAPKPLGWAPNLRAPLHGVTALKGHVGFAIDMTLAGTEVLNIAPTGDSNHVEMTSPWPSPLFAGQFLPRTREVSDKGFTAVWDVSSLASATQTQMTANEFKGVDVLNVSLLTPIDPYKLGDRATKYGILFVLLTFGGFFLFEMLKELPIHPMQYLLVGFGLAIFFLLLVSFSEHTRFGTAYVISSAASIGLLAFYLSYVLHSVARGVGFGGMLTTLYAALYGLLINEDNALVLGSMMLFVLLAAVMVLTRRVDWYRGRVAAPPPPRVAGSGL